MEKIIDTSDIQKHLVEIQDILFKKGPNPQSPIPNPQSPIPNPQSPLINSYNYFV